MTIKMQRVYVTSTIKGKVSAESEYMVGTQKGSWYIPLIKDHLINYHHYTPEYVDSCFDKMGRDFDEIIEEIKLVEKIKIELSMNGSD